MKFTEFILDNYEKKLKDFDLNYHNINNLEKQINFNLLELNYNENHSLNKKIEIITKYLKQNLNTQFLFNNDKIDTIEDFQNIEKINDNEIIYENIKEFNNEFWYLVDFNKDLFILCTENIIYLMSKITYETKIKIRESEVNDIQFCEKIDDEKFVIQIPNYILIIKIINNIDYMIMQKYELLSDNYDFNPKFDIIYIKVEKGYYRNTKYHIYFQTFSSIMKNSISHKLSEVSDNGRPKKKRE